MSRADVALGRIDADHDVAYLYRLPYGDEVSFPIIQAYGAKLSHRGAERYTLDFGMPVGTPVHAARDGVVVLVEDSHDVGCPHEECGRFANFAVVLHSDGLSSRWNLGTYPGLARRHPMLVAGVLYRDFGRRTDDAAVVVVREAA